MNKKTSIQVSKDVKDVITSFGKKGDSYDTILRKLLKRSYDWDNVHVISIPFATKNSIQYMDIILPKVDSMHINPDEFSDALNRLCTDKDITVLDDDEVPPY